MGRRREGGGGVRSSAEGGYRRYAIVNEADVAEGLVKLAGYLEGGKRVAGR